MLKPFSSSEQNLPEPNSRHTSDEQVLVDLEGSQLAHPHLKLRYQSWSEGLGWITQKTITVKLEDGPGLILALKDAVANGLMISTQPSARISAKTNGKKEAPSKIVPFPVGRAGRNNLQSTNRVDGSDCKMLEFKSRKPANQANFAR